MFGEKEDERKERRRIRKKKKTKFEKQNKRGSIEPRDCWAQDIPGRRGTTYDIHVFTHIYPRTCLYISEYIDIQNT